MTDNQLENVNEEDLEDLLVKVEDSFCIKFVDYELVHIKTFGELCDHIANKIQLLNSSDCTTQQAFYKLRESLNATLHLEKNEILLELPLNVVFPRPSRRSKIKGIEKYLGFKLKILRPPYWITYSLCIMALASLLGFFFFWQLALLGLTFSIATLWFANKLGNELDVKTIGDVVEKMTMDNYVKSRRDSKTYNTNEIESVLSSLFCKYLSIERDKLTRDSKFNL